ncbi:cell wall hydrolase [Paenibacillus eucommiae]|uniref:N-acetylmuramoyl-L-alanine amidase n=1 Tax=Paenibacillus eucommiae TaxID=1355755 RepID=A0ABS4INN8_9BACL|nr:cell wall hydrolase [Paenibacillus eucommiae]MBP1989178.1 N-acetylmuramoyl-L-alanine amidase [Paenibacillus eucommiae]
MTLLGRLRILGYKQPRLEEALQAFQHDFRIKEASPSDQQIIIKRLKQLTSGNPDMELLARVIYSEARGEPYRGKVAVGAVVLNRYRSPDFPNTLRGVITQPLAFSVIADGSFWLQPNRQAYNAAREALQGTDPTGNCCYFFNPQTATSPWIRKLRPKMRIGRHVFA